MYRFRPIDALIGEYKELENQEIYFASPEQLNDPMEGFKDIFWEGDDIVWKNLLKHYLMCFFMCIEYYIEVIIIDKSGEKMDSSYIPVFNSENDFIINGYKKAFDEIKSNFFSYECISKLLNLLANRKSPIRKNELLLYLKLIHPYIINCVFRVLESHGFISKTNKFKLNNSRSNNFNDLFESINKIDDNMLKKYDKNIESFFEADINILNQLELILKYNNKDKKISNNELFFMNRFPKEYLSRVEDIIYPNWYVACFMDKCDNSSVWGNYGDNHKGVCLKFRIKEQNGLKSIKLKKPTGYNSSSGEIIEYVDQSLNKVKYTNQFIGIDFFRSLGKLPTPQINSQWYKGENGQFSKCKAEMEYSIDKWRELYWNKFEKCTLTKTKDWEYENEYRLIINNSFFNYENGNNRKLKYDFNDLDGIIFGMKTSDMDKLKIIEIIEKKCRLKGRDKFNFYQASYCKENGRIKPIKLNLLQF